MAAVSPAHPEPMMMTLRICYAFVLSRSFSFYLMSRRATGGLQAGGLLW
jgi:hypothetical protein